MEGLAIRNERLYFGLRGPVNQAVGYILSVDSDAIFQGADARAMVTGIALSGNAPT